MFEKKQTGLEHLPADTRLIDLVRNNEPVDTLRLVSPADVPAEANTFPAYEAHVFKGHRTYFKKEGGLYEVASDPERNQRLIHAADAYKKAHPRTTLTFYFNLWGYVNGLESYRTNRILTMISRFKSIDVDNYADAFVPIYSDIETLRGALKENAALMDALATIERSVREIEANAKTWTLPQIDAALQRIDLRPLQAIKTHIEDQLRDKTVGQLITEKKTKKYPGVHARLQRILNAADEKKPTRREDGYGVTTVECEVDGKRVEVRYFADDAYHRTKTEDFIARVDYFCNVAQCIRDTEKVQEIRARYHKRIHDEAALEIDRVNHMPKQFPEKIEAARKIFAEFQAELIGAVYPEDDFLEPKTGVSRYEERMEDFKKVARQYLIDKGRPIIVHVFPDNSISAHFPKGEKTYPGDYRTDRTVGVTPNSVIDVVAYRNGPKQPVRVESVFSRAASNSVFGMDKEKESRQELNYQNVVKDIQNYIDSLELDFKDGDVFELTSVSLLSLLRDVVEQATRQVIKTFESERRQELDIAAALERLNNQMIPVRGRDGQTVNIKIDVLHFVFSVKNLSLKKKLNFNKIGLDTGEIKKINEPAFKKYIQKQRESLEIREEINSRSDFESLIARAKEDDRKQEVYFLRACQIYFDKKAAKNEAKQYQLVANIIRSEQLRNAHVFVNCKTSKDRTGQASNALKTYVDQEVLKVPEETFNQRFRMNSEYGVSLQATHENSPGARGNRVNNPFEKDEQKVDSSTSNLNKIKFKAHKSRPLLELADKSAQAVRMTVKGHKVDPNEKPTHVYLLDKTNKFVKYDYAELIAEKYGAEEDFKIAVEKQHVIYESANQLKYEPPIGTKFGGAENTANNDILWQVIQHAMTTFKLTDYSQLEFEGTLKEKALAEIERRKALATSDATKLHERERIAMSLKDPKSVEAASATTAPTV